MPDGGGRVPGERRRLAIACQGGGSHSAFTAGVLDCLLRSERLWDAYELVAISGTSGGAVCAALTWSGLWRRGSLDAQARADAAGRLDAFWSELGSPLNPDQFGNFFSLAYARLPFAAETVSPLASVWVELRMRMMLGRHLSLPATPEERASAALGVFLGATNLETGARAVFGRDLVDVDHVVASSAIPPLFRPAGASVRADGEQASFWDGLYSANPPLRELAAPGSQAVPPEEIWVIRLNPEAWPHMPLSYLEVLDRRNELSGNTALAHELQYIELLNDIVAQHGSGGTLSVEHTRQVDGKPVRERKSFRHIDVHQLRLERVLDSASKLSIDPEHIRELREEGWRAASAWLLERGVRAPARPDYRPRWVAAF